MTKISIPKDWIETSLVNVCGIAIGGTPSRSNPNLWDSTKQTSNLWVSIKDLSNTYIEDTEEYISNEGIKKSNVKKVIENTVLMSFKLTVGRIGIAKKTLYTNEAIAALVPSDSLTNDYLYQGLHYWDLLGTVDQAIKGATLNKEKIKQIKIFFPKSTIEQGKIAEILLTIDETISDTELLIEKYKGIKQGLMQDLFTYGIDEKGQVRREKTHKFKNSPLGRIPEEWVISSFSDISKVRQGLQIAISERKHEPGENRYQYITIQYLNDRNSFNDYVQNPPKSVVCTKDDILLTRTGNMGMVITNENGVFHNNFFMVDFDRKKISKEWLVYYLNRDKIQNLFSIYAGVTTIPDLKHGDFYRTPCVYPKLINEQTAITNILSSSDSAIEKEEIYKQKLLSLKQGLMDDLLSGKVRVNKLLN